LFQDIITPIAVIAEVYLQKIGEKEYSQDQEHYEQFNQDDNPDSLPPPRHVTEAVIIKPEYAADCLSGAPHFVSVSGSRGSLPKPEVIFLTGPKL
jgi:hypothetical protein